MKTVMKAFIFKICRKGIYNILAQLEIKNTYIACHVSENRIHNLILYIEKL